MDKAPNVVSEFTHFQRQSHNLSGGSDVLETGGVVENFHIWVFHISFPLPLMSNFKDAKDTENYFIKGWFWAWYFSNLLLSNLLSGGRRHYSPWHRVPLSVPHCIIPNLGHPEGYNINKWFWWQGSKNSCLCALLLITVCITKTVFFFSLPHCFHKTYKDTNQSG